MKPDSPEQLLGYLLDALEDDERQQIDELLEQNPDLQQKLDALALQLKPMHADRELPDPPTGLAIRTCELIARSASAAESQFSMVKLREKKSDMPSVSLSPVMDAAAVRTISMADFFVAAGILIAVSMLFFPALANSRLQTHLNYCQDNLREIGLAMWDYQNQQRSLPPIAETGNRSVAGVYAPILFDSGWLKEPSVLICPASELAQNRSTWRGIPKLQELDAAQGAVLRELQAQMGGSYGYNLGYVVNGRYTMTRQLANPTLPIMADSPSVDLNGRRSRNHGGHGQNVLFADNHIRFVTDCSTTPCDDSIFLNRQGIAAAGLDAEDVVIGSSGTSPFPVPGMPIQLIKD